MSTFTSYYIHLWPSFFPDKPLSSPLPSFDGRIVLYPTVENLRDYLSWRQVDCMFLLQSFFLSLPTPAPAPIPSFLSHPLGENLGSKRGGFFFFCLKMTQVRECFINGTIFTDDDDDDDVWVGCVRSYQQSLQHYVLGFAAKRRNECDRGGEGTQGKSSLYILSSFPKGRNPRHPTFPFIFLDWVREAGAKRIYLSF